MNANTSIIIFLCVSYAKIFKTSNPITSPLWAGEVLNSVGFGMTPRISSHLSSPSRWGSLCLAALFKFWVWWFSFSKYNKNTEILAPWMIPVARTFNILENIWRAEVGGCYVPDSRILGIRGIKGSRTQNPDTDNS